MRRCWWSYFDPFRLEELLQQKEKVLQEMSRRENRFEEEFRVMRSRVDTDHARNIADLENQISAIRLEAQSDKQARTFPSACIDCISVLMLAVVWVVCSSWRPTRRLGSSRHFFSVMLRL